MSAIRPISQMEKPRSREVGGLPGYHFKLNSEAGRGRLCCQYPNTTIGILSGRCLINAMKEQFCSFLLNMY